MESNYGVPKDIDIEEILKKKNVEYDLDLIESIKQISTVISNFCIQMEIMGDTIRMSTDLGYYN